MFASSSTKCVQLRFAQQQQFKAAAITAPSQHPRHRHRARRVVTKAQLGSMFDTVVTWGALAASAGAIVYSIFYDWKEAKQQQLQAQQQQPQQEASLFGPPDNTSWAVMGFVSCIPFFNYLAFAQGALTSDNPRVWYWATAFYAMPMLYNGFELDWWSIAMVALGAAHVQALRIGATEPELQAKLQQQLKPLAVVRTLVNAAGAATGAALGTGSSSSSSGGQLGAGSSRAVKDVLQEEEQALEVEEAQRQQRELEEFDRRLQQMPRDKSD